MDNQELLISPVQETPNNDLDPYRAAPQELRDVWKWWTKTKAPFPDVSPLLQPAPSNLPASLLVDEFVHFVIGHLYSLFKDDSRGLASFTSKADSLELGAKLSMEDVLPSGIPHQTTYSKEEFTEYAKSRLDQAIRDACISANSLSRTFEVGRIPGLKILPDLLPPIVQQCLLDVLLHREFSRAENQTNFHLNYHVSYPEGQMSIFSIHPETSSFTPKNVTQNKPLSNRTALDKSLHWITLGGQYDWTNKLYPSETPPKFAADIAALIGSVFTDMVPEAAIINVYSARDKLSMHRDVSEEADRGLVSISLGCSCIFIIGLQDNSTGKVVHETLKLNSGDAVYMAGESRYAWHGVPKIIPDTCPEYLQYWPGNLYPDWNGWMGKKRINLNIRQMF